MEIAHAILSTADRLSYFGVRVSTACHCGAPETLLHLFTLCPFALRLAAWYESMVRRILHPASVLNQSHAQMSGHSWLFCGTGEGIMPPEDLRRQVAASMGTVISRGRAPLHRRGHQAPRRLTQNQIKCSTGH